MASRAGGTEDGLASETQRAQVRSGRRKRGRPAKPGAKSAQQKAADKRQKRKEAKEAQRQLEAEQARLAHHGRSILGHLSGASRPNAPEHSEEHEEADQPGEDQPGEEQQAHEGAPSQYAHYEPARHCVLAPWREFRTGKEGKGT